MHTFSFVFGCLFLVLVEGQNISFADPLKGGKQSSETEFRLSTKSERSNTLTEPDITKKYSNRSFISILRPEDVKTSRSLIQDNGKSILKNDIKKCGFGFPLVIRINVPAAPTTTTVATGTPDARS